jgi:DNA-nicking Smr family endonuclease
MQDEDNKGVIDKEAWDEYKQTVRKLGEAKAIKSVAKQPSTEAIESNRVIVRERTIRDHSALKLGEKHKLSKKMLSQLRKGQLPIEATVDLHGHNSEAAHGMFEHFIGQAVASGKRLLLIITGKGQHSAGGVGILQQSILPWINNAEFAGRVLFVDYALPKHGGTGAFYIILRR